MSKPKKSCLKKHKIDDEWGEEEENINEEEKSDECFEDSEDNIDEDTLKNTIKNSSKNSKKKKSSNTSSTTKTLSNIIEKELEQDSSKTLIYDSSRDIESMSANELSRLAVEEIQIPKDPPIKDIKMLEFKNPLSSPLKEEFARMTPLELFMYVIDEFSDETAKLTKEYANFAFGDNATPISRTDIELYIFVFIFLSVYQLPEYGMLWEDSKCMHNVIPRLITKAGFKRINKYFCIFQNNDETYKENQKVNPLKKTDKIDRTISYYNSKWQEMYPFTKYITIDEAMTAYKGDISFKQIIKDKHKKMGIKFFAKASADRGYMYQIIPYSGKGFIYDENIGMGASIVKTLTEGHEHKGYHFTLDSYYSNLYSFKYLYDHGIDFTATFIKDRKAMPEKVRKTLLRPGQSVLYQIKNTSIKMYVFYAIKQIQVASSCFGVEKVKYINKMKHLKYKPEMIAYYNQTKCGIDLVDCATNIYKSQRKTYKWWKAVLFYLIDISLNNCKIIFLDSPYHEKPRYCSAALFFRRILINQFIEYFSPGLEPELRLSRIDPLPFLEACHFRLLQNDKKPCFFCRARFGKVSRTEILCSVCNVELCGECFNLWHEKQVFRFLYV